MDLFNISKKKLEVKNDNTDLKDFKEKTTSQNAKDNVDAFIRVYPKPPLMGKIFDATGEGVKRGIDDQTEIKFRKYKEAKRLGILEESKPTIKLNDADIKEFKKRLQEEENEKRLKE